MKVRCGSTALKYVVIRRRKYSQLAEPLRVPPSITKMNSLPSDSHLDLKDLYFRPIWPLGVFQLLWMIQFWQSFPHHMIPKTTVNHNFTCEMRKNKEKMFWIGSCSKRCKKRMIKEMAHLVHSFLLSSRFQLTASMLNYIW